MSNNILLNGRFLHNLNGWTADNASYSAGDGDEHYGVAVLQTGGGYIEQAFSVYGVKSYSIHISAKSASGTLTTGNATVSIVDGEGNSVYSADLSGTTAAWTDNNLTAGLADGAVYTLRITNVNAAGNVKVDDVWLYFVPMTRSQIATRVHAKLGRLATERSLSTTPSGTLTEGDYTFAIDAALRSVGALDDDTSEPDIRKVDSDLLQTALDMVEREMLEKLRNDYAVEVDEQIGQRRYNLSQVGEALSKTLGSDTGGGGTSGRVIVRKMNHA